MRPERKKVVLSTSDEAAKLMTVTGWVDRHGHFWGNDERMARYSGATHFPCDCGGQYEKPWTKCDVCRANSETERYYALPEKPWDGESPLYSDASDLYFFSVDELLDFIHDEDGRSYETLRLKLCAPNLAREIDGNDYFSDDLPDDGEIPEKLADAFEELNRVIRDQPPLSWSPVGARPTVDSLPAQEAA